MTTEQITQAIYEEIKLKLSRQYFDSEAEMNFCKAGDINGRYIYDIEVSVSCDSFVDDPDNDNNYNIYKLDT